MSVPADISRQEIDQCTLGGHAEREPSKSNKRHIYARAIDPAGRCWPLRFDPIWPRRGYFVRRIAHAALSSGPLKWSANASFGPAASHLRGGPDVAAIGQIVCVTAGAGSHTSGGRRIWHGRAWAGAAANKAARCGPGLARRLFLASRARASDLSQNVDRLRSLPARQRWLAKRGSNEPI